MGGSGSPPTGSTQMIREYIVSSCSQAIVRACPSRGEVMLRGRIELIGCLRAGWYLRTVGSYCGGLGSVSHLDMTTKMAIRRVDAPPNAVIQFHRRHLVLILQQMTAISKRRS